jgi:hypothetical protein
MLRGNVYMKLNCCRTLRLGTRSWLPLGQINMMTVIVYCLTELPLIHFVGELQLRVKSKMCVLAISYIRK